MSQVTRKDLGFSQGASFYEKLAPAERDEMQCSGMPRRYGRGALLTSEGDPTNVVTILFDGWAKAVTTTTVGNPVLLRLYGPGDLIGGEAVISGQVSPESIIALTQVSCLRILASRFDNLLARNRGIDLGFRDAMAQRVLAADQQVRDRLCPADVRLARLLTDLAHRSGIETPGHAYPDSSVAGRPGELDRRIPRCRRPHSAQAA